MYGEEFDFPDVKLVIDCVSQSAIHYAPSEHWVKVYEEDFPGVDDKASGEMIRDQVATVEIPDEIRENGRYAVRVWITAQTDSTKQGWTFEGVGVTRAD